jgi:hypothetical protein
MQTNFSPSRWSAFRSTLVLGIPLGLLQIGLLSGSILLWPSFASWSALACCVLSYLLLPALAGFLAAGRNDEGLKAGCLVGVPSLLTVAVAGIVAVIVTFLSPPLCHCPGDAIIAAFGGWSFAVLALVIGGVSLDAMGIFVAILGGWIGAALHLRFATQPSQRSTSAEQSRPSN